MKPKPIVLLIAFAALASILATACGGDDGGEEAGIRTQKGLSVAALAAGAEVGEETDDLGSDGELAAGAPASDTAVGTDRRSAIAPDVAPVPYPSLQESQTGVTVQGYGSASVDADSAVVELYFGGEFIDGIEPPLPVPEAGDVEPEAGETEPGFEESSSGQGVSSDTVRLGEPGTRSFRAQEITEADLQPVVDAIVAAGVSSDDVEVIVEPSYGDVYYSVRATIRVTMHNVDALGGIVEAATDAASRLEDISFNGSSVSYTTSDCSSLEQAAMEAAVEDARERGQSFASALGVGLGAVVGASHYSYSPFGSPCDSTFDGPYPLGGISYAEGQSPEVQLVATVTITFAIQ
jgi:uncharacterized protein YggE